MAGAKKHIIQEDVRNEERTPIMVGKTDEA